MVHKIEFEVNDEDFDKIRHFKKVFNVVMDEEIEMEDYYQAVMAIGIKSMFKDVIPQDREILWNTLMKIKDDKPAYFSEFVADVLKKGEGGFEDVSDDTGSYIR